VASAARLIDLLLINAIRRWNASLGDDAPASSRWRMHLAAHHLRHSTDTVESIGRAVGHSSEYAFNRACARHLSQPPGRYRRGRAAPA
jgi:transcriptional regulator GlxA family with amidase domain